MKILKIVKIEGHDFIAITAQDAEELLWEIEGLKEHLPHAGSTLIEFCKLLDKLHFTTNGIKQK